MDTMLRFTVDQATASLGDNSQADFSILDVGTGNGVLPLELASLGLSRVTGEQEAIGLLSKQGLIQLPDC